MGAEFILNAIHSGRDQRHRPFHESSSELWARALRLPIIQVNAAAADGGAVTATSGAINSDGDRYVAAPDVGEQYFVCEVAVPAAEDLGG